MFVGFTTFTDGTVWIPASDITRILTFQSAARVWYKGGPAEGEDFASCPSLTTYIWVPKE